MSEYEPPASAAEYRRPAQDRPGAVPVDPEVHKQRFEELGGLFDQGEFARQNEDGTVTTVRSFERAIDPLNRRERTLLEEFRLRAAAAGLREAFSPLVL